MLLPSHFLHHTHTHTHTHTQYDVILILLVPILCLEASVSQSDHLFQVLKISKLVI